MDWSMAGTIYFEEILLFLSYHFHRLQPILFNGLRIDESLINNFVVVNSIKRAVQKNANKNIIFYFIYHYM